MPLSDKAQHARDALLRQADHGRAIEVSNQIIEEMLQRFNDAETTFGTSLLARALVARAMIGVAADWWNSAAGALPTPEAYAAIMSLVTDLPPEFEDVSYIIRGAG